MPNDCHICNFYHIFPNIMPNILVVLDDKNNEVIFELEIKNRKRLKVKNLKNY